MIGEEATSLLPVFGIGATMMGEEATSLLPVFGIGATMMGEEAKATVAVVIRAEARITDLTFNEIEIIGVLLPKRNFVPKWYPKSCMFSTTKVTFSAIWRGFSTD